MAFVYFHKETKEFQFVLAEKQDFEWNECHEVADATVRDIYRLEDDTIVLVRSISDEEIARQEKSFAEIQRTQYQIARAAAYPSIGDQLDALFHAGVFPPDMAAIIQAVKDAHPKEGN